MLEDSLETYEISDKEEFSKIICMTLQLAKFINDRKTGYECDSTLVN